jgi:hypothetical protein
MRRLLFIATALVTLATPAHAQLTLDSLKSLWQKKQYATVIRPLVDLRATSKAEDQLTIDYMIATSHCRLPDANQRAKGRLAFDAMLLYHYRSLSIEQQNQLLAERGKCGAGQPANPNAVRFVSMNTRRGEARATYNFAGGKQFTDVCRATPSGTAPRYEVTREQPLQGTKSQPVFTHAQIDQARASVQQTMQTMGAARGKVRARDGIVLASLGTHTTVQLDSLLSTLLLYRDFYAREYGLIAPDTVVRVYLVPTQSAMTRLAAELHGFPPDTRLIGYSVLSDFTIVGIIPRAIFGTLMHELMHVLFRHKYPMAPPWLDEGLAALYEVSRVRGERVVGIPNWRGQVLHRTREMPAPRGVSPELAYFPTLAELLDMNWTEYEGGGGSAQQATNHALARYFILYLQERGKLPQVVQAVGGIAPLEYHLRGDSINFVAMDGVRMYQTVANALGLQPAQLQADFDAWLAGVIKAGWEPCR